MRSKAIALFTAAVLLLNMAGFALADTRTAAAKRRQTNALVALLPASDGVATVDVHRLFADALPQILSGNQPLMAMVTAHLDEMQSKTSIDIRKFDTVAVGATFSMGADKKVKSDIVGIARGDVRAGSIVAVAKLGSNGTYREEKFGDRTIYVFSAKEMAKATIAADPKAAGAPADKVKEGLDLVPEEIAVTSLDSNTIVFGSLARVKEALDGKTHVSPEITALLTGHDSSVMNFGVKMPAGASAMLPVDNDELGKNVNSIRYMSGSMDVTAAGTSLQMIAKTAKAEQAQSLYDTLDGLKMVGKAFLGGSKRADQRMYARLIDSAKVTVRGSTVTMDLLVAQADVDALVKLIKY